MNLIKLSVRRPVLVAMFMSALVGLGIFCYLQLPMELFPDVEFPVVTVVTRYEGAGPEEIEQLITKELEEELKKWVLDRLAKYKYPRWIVFVKELPKSSTGKIQRYKLR